MITWFDPRLSKKGIEEAIEEDNKEDHKTNIHFQNIKITIHNIQPLFSYPIWHSKYADLAQETWQLTPYSLQL